MTELALAIIGVGVMLLLGIPGIVAGRRVSAETGPDTRMDYPLGSWRLRRNLVPARWVVRVGWGFCLAAPLMIPAVYGWDAVNPFAIARRDGSACRHILPESTIGHYAGAKVVPGYLFDDGTRCRANFNVERPERGYADEVLDLDVHPTRGMGGAPELDRESRRHGEDGRRVEALPEFGRAFVAMAADDKPYADHEVYIEQGGVVVKLGFDRRYFDWDAMMGALRVAYSHMDLAAPYASP